MTDTASEATARPWVVPAGESNEHVICVGDDAGKPDRIICILHPANFSYDRLSYDELTAVAALIVEAVNAYEPLKAHLAEVERERDDFKERLAVADASLVLETGAGIDTHETMLRVSKRWCARAHAAEARVAVLEEALESIRQYGSDTLSGRADGGSDDRQWQREAVREMTRRARTALAEQKEAGK